MNRGLSQTHLRIFAIASVLMLCVCAGGYAWLFLEARDTLTQATQLSEESQLVATRNAHTQTVRRVVRDTATEREELNTYFISDDELVTFLSDLEALGGYSNTALSVSSVQVGDALDKDGRVVELELIVEAEGTFAGVMHALSLLETFPVALEVRDARLVQQVNSPDWKGTFEVVAVRAEPPKGGM